MNAADTPADFLEANADEFQCVWALLERAGLTEAMADGELSNTYFLPTDAAFITDLAVGGWVGGWVLAALGHWGRGGGGKRVESGDGRGPGPPNSDSAQNASILPSPVQQTAPALSVEPEQDYVADLTVDQVGWAPHACTPGARCTCAIDR